MVNRPPEHPGSYEYNCKECGKLVRCELTQEDVDDGSKDGDLICYDCLAGIAEIKLQREPGSLR
jgi:hypothetical protein